MGAPEAQLHPQPKLHPWIPEIIYDDTTDILNGVSNTMLSTLLTKHRQFLYKLVEDEDCDVQLCISQNHRTTCQTRVQNCHALGV